MLKKRISFIFSGLKFVPIYFFFFDLTQININKNVKRILAPKEKWSPDPERFLFASLFLFACLLFIEDDVLSFLPQQNS